MLEHFGDIGGLRSNPVVPPAYIAIDASSSGLVVRIVRATHRELLHRGELTLDQIQP